MMSRQYTSRVSGVLGDLSYVNNQVGTGRRFFKGSEDPSSAAKAYQLRRQSAQNDDYLTNLEDANSSLQTKESSMTQVNKALEDVYSSLLGILNETNGTTEQATIAAQLRSVQDTIVMDMNTKYGDKFLFGGSGVSEVPFELSDSGTLTYRGVDVSGTGTFTWPDGTTQDSMEVLDELSKDTLYTDLGFGLTLSSGEVVGGSAYNTAVAGINVLGYGTDSEGMSENVVLLLGQMADMLEAGCDSSDLDPYVNKFLEEKNTVLNSITKVGSESTFLEYTKTRLEDVQDNLDEKISLVEDIDAEEAIINLNMVDYMYQAVLKTSSNILSVSFIDFMD
jgi:flagellar hook-associated protein 3 FlgL